MVVHVIPSDWPSSSPPPQCFLYDPAAGELEPSAQDLEPFGVAQSALIPKPCVITTETTCYTRDFRVGVVHARLLNRGTEAWADAYFDNNEDTGCRWGDTLEVPYDSAHAGLTPVAQGTLDDIDNENGFRLGHLFLEFWDCGSAAYCGTGSASQETSVPCSGGGTYLDDHTRYIVTTSIPDMAYGAVWPLGGCGNLEIAPPCTLYGTTGCVRWYWFHLRTYQENYNGITPREANDYGCIRVRWCGSRGCP